MSIKDHSWRMPIAYLKVFLQFAASRDLPPDPLLLNTGLHAASLLQSDEPVSLAATRQVLANVTRLLGSGWHLSLGPRLTTATHGPLGFAVVTAADMRGAVDCLLRFIGLRGPFLWPAGTLEGNEFVIRLYETTELGAERGILIELALLSMQGMLERPLGREMQGARIALAYPAPDYRGLMDSAFHASLMFDAKRHSLRFPASWLDEPCALFDEAMHRYLLTRCEKELTAGSGGLPAEIAVRQALLARPGHLPGLTEIAASQHVSPRTLIRRLKRGGTSYQAILEDVRRTLAVDYLLHSALSINRIAYRLGYQDPSNFGRAFRHWFGVPPGQYRDNQRSL